MADSPIVSICIPTFNRAGWLRQAVASCLQQSYADIEVVVSDNASEDDTASVVKEFADSRVRYLRQQSPVPPVANWNSSWRESTGELLTFLCDDDVLEPGFVRSLIELVRRYPDASLYRSGLRAIDSQGQTLWEFSEVPETETPKDFLEQRVRFERPQFLPGFLFRRNDIEAVEGVLEVGLPGMLYVDDFLWFRLAFRGSQVAGVKEPLWCYRQHELQYGGKAGLDLESFAAGLGQYTGLLAAIAEQNGCSDHLVSFLTEEYEEELLRSRIQIELRRARARSFFSYLSRLSRCLRLGRGHGLDATALLRSSWS
jgi:glycosyltransferase involved in cell wall biosynthesis